MIFTRKTLPYAFLMLSLLATACTKKADNPNALVKLEITNAPGSLIVLREGESSPIELAFLPQTVDKNALTFTYTSGDEKVFIVDEKGMIQAKVAGDAVLHVMTYSNLLVRTSCNVKVIRKDAVLATDLTIADDKKSVIMGRGTSFDLAPAITLLPENVTVNELSYTSSNVAVASVSNKGVVTATSKGKVTITVGTLDGSRKEVKCEVTIKDISREEYNRSNWVLSWAYDLKYTDAVNPTGDQNAILDGDPNTCSIIIKPGKTFGGITAPADKPSFFVVDMGEPSRVDWLYYRDRNASGTAANSSIGLRVRGFTLSGSDDGIAFTDIRTVPVEEIPFVTSTVDHNFDMPSSTYRYYKFNLDVWDTSVAGNTTQLSEFKLGKFELVD